MISLTIPLFYICLFAFKSWKKTVNVPSKIFDSIDVIKWPIKINLIYGYLPDWTKNQIFFLFAF